MTEEGKYVCTYLTTFKDTLQLAIAFYQFNLLLA